MIYELSITCYAHQQADFNDVLDKLDDSKHLFIVIKPGQPDQQCSTINLIENHHDETPPQPCHSISHWDNCPNLPP